MTHTETPPLQTLTMKLARIVLIWFILVVVVGAPLFYVSGKRTARQAALLTAGAIADAMSASWEAAVQRRIGSDDAIERFNQVVAYPTIRAIALVSENGGLAFSVGDAGAPVDPDQLRSGSGVDTAGNPVLLREISRSGSITGLAVWPAQAWFWDAYVRSFLMRSSYYAVVVLVLLGVLFLIIRSQYLAPLRELTFAVRDNRTDVLTRIARTTNALEFHTMIASFLGLMNQNERRHEELEEAVAQRTSELKTAQKQMVQQEKLASLGQLAAGVAHEINNPAGYIVGNLDVLRDYVAVMEKRLRSCDLLLAMVGDGSRNQDVLRATAAEILKDDEETDYTYVLGDLQGLFNALFDGMRRITTIVQGLNSFARDRTSQPERVDLTAVVENSLQIVWNELKYDYTVEVDTREGLATTAVSSQLEQVLVNLLLNARDATSPGGTISVTLGENDGMAVISVMDDGEGIPEDTVDRIFDPFFTTKPVGSGTGLGLAICHEIVTDAGGTITVDSVAGAGTRFDVALPLAPATLEEILESDEQ